MLVVMTIFLCATPGCNWPQDTGHERLFSHTFEKLLHYQQLAKPADGRLSDPDVNMII